MFAVFCLSFITISKNFNEKFDFQNVLLKYLKLTIQIFDNNVQIFLQQSILHVGMVWLEPNPTQPKPRMGWVWCGFLIDQLNPKFSGWCGYFFIFIDSDL